jgi:class 3 adenylate cyclase/TolB-like protein
MATQSVDRKLTAIMFTDIVGFTSLMRADEKKALNILYYNRQLLDPLIKKYNGEILKEMGDGTLNSFSSAIEAVRCALEIQETLEEVPALNLHIGDVIDTGEDIFGDGVNIASRIQNLADSGGICISQAVNDSIQSQSDIRAISIGMRELKGIEGKQEIFSLMVKDAPILTENEVGVLKGRRKEGDKFNARPFLSWIAGTIISILVLFQVVNLFTKTQTTVSSNSIAVFPFDNMRNDTEYDWLTDSFSESLTFKISSSKTLKVIDRLTILNTLKQYDPEKAGFMEVASLVGKKINANLVLTGSFTTLGDEIQITTMLIDLQSGEVTPIVKERYKIDDLLTLLEDISLKVFEKLETL